MNENFKTTISRSQMCGILKTDYRLVKATSFVGFIKRCNDGTVTLYTPTSERGLWQITEKSLDSKKDIDLIRKQIYHDVCLDMWGMWSKIQDKVDQQPKKLHNDVYIKIKNSVENKVRHDIAFYIKQIL